MVGSPKKKPALNVMIIAQNVPDPILITARPVWTLWF
jgi:hypothetical protein